MGRRSMGRRSRIKSNIYFQLSIIIFKPRHNFFQNWQGSTSKLDGRCASQVDLRTPKNTFNGSRAFSQLNACDCHTRSDRQAPLTALGFGWFRMSAPDRNEKGKGGRRKRSKGVRGDAGGLKREVAEEKKKRGEHSEPSTSNATIPVPDIPTGSRLLRSQRSERNLLEVPPLNRSISRQSSNSSLQSGSTQASGQTTRSGPSTRSATGSQRSAPNYYELDDSASSGSDPDPKGWSDADYVPEDFVFDDRQDDDSSDSEDQETPSPAPNAEDEEEKEDPYDPDQPNPFKTSAELMEEYCGPVDKKISAALQECQYLLRLIPFILHSCVF